MIEITVNLKRLIYSLIYMDNGAISANSSEELSWAYDQLNNIFNPYIFAIQQCLTNDEYLKSRLEEDSPPSVVDLFGIKWNIETDKFELRKRFLIRLRILSAKFLKPLQKKLTLIIMTALS